MAAAAVVELRAACRGDKVGLLTIGHSAIIGFSNQGISRLAKTGLNGFLFLPFFLSFFYANHLNSPFQCKQMITGRATRLTIPHLPPLSTSSSLPKNKQQVDLHLVWPVRHTQKKKEGHCRDIAAGGAVRKNSRRRCRLPCSLFPAPCSCSSA